MYLMGGTAIGDDAERTQWKKRAAFIAEYFVLFTI